MSDFEKSSKRKRNRKFYSNLLFSFLSTVAVIIILLVIYLYFIVE